MIATPFFVLTGGILEMGIVMLASNSLQNATQVAAQNIESGTVAADAGSFRQAICERLPSILSCEGSLVINAEAVSDWSEFESDRQIVNSFPADTGSNDLFIRVAYDWPVMLPTAVFGMDVANQDGYYILAATAVVR